MAIKHILIAIDGTGSREWIREKDGLNSHVYRFCKDFEDGVDPIKGNKRKYISVPKHLIVNTTYMGRGLWVRM